MFKINDPVTKAPAVRNPYAYVKEGELLFPGMAFEKFAGAGRDLHRVQRRAHGV